MGRCVGNMETASKLSFLHMSVSPFFYTMFVYNQHNKLRDQIICISIFKILNTRSPWPVIAGYYKLLRLQWYGERVISHLYSKHTVAAVNYSLLWRKCEPNCCSAAYTTCFCVCSGLVQWIRGAAAVTKPITDSSSTFELIGLSVSAGSDHHGEFNHVQSLIIWMSSLHCNSWLFFSLIAAVHL